MESEKSPKKEISIKEVSPTEEQVQETYIPDFRQTVADTRSKTCGITWKLHPTNNDKASNDMNSDEY
jgi:hypothetical protein